LAGTVRALALTAPRTRRTIDRAGRTRRSGRRMTTNDPVITLDERYSMAGAPAVPWPEAR
jgi:hypothetical protein